MWSAPRPFPLVAALVALLGGGVASSPAPQLEALTLTVIAPTAPGARRDVALRFEADSMTWLPEPPFDTAFAALRRVEIERPSAPDRPLEVRVDFIPRGDEDPDRLFLVDLRAADAAGRALFHTWSMEPDGRISVREGAQALGGRVPFAASRVNSANLEVPGVVAPRVASLAIQLQPMSPEERRHVPRRPHKLDLAMSRPDATGAFEISFAGAMPLSSRPNWRPDPATDAFAMTLTIKNAEGRTLDRVLRFVDVPEPGRDGRFRFAWRVPPAHLDHSTFSLVIYTKQIDNAEFIRRFFIEGGSSGYRGMWISDGGDLLELPYEDARWGR